MLNQFEGNLLPGAIDMAKKRKAKNARRKQSAKKNKSKKQQAFEPIVTYVPGIPT